MNELKCSAEAIAEATQALYPETVSMGFGVHHEEADFCLIEFTPGTLQDIFEILKPHKGEYVSRIAPLKFVITPTTIMDAQGNILEVIE